MNNQNKSLKLKLIKTVHAHELRINSVQLFPSGNLISVSDDYSIKIYDKDLNVLQHILNAHKDCIPYVCVKDDNHFVTCSGDKNIKTWKKVNNIFVENIKIQNAHDNHIFKVLYSNDDIISCSLDESFKIWEKTKENRYQNNIVIKCGSKVYSILSLEDKNMIITSGHNGTTFYNKFNYDIIASIPESYCGSWNALDRIDDDRIIVGGGNDHIMKVINVKEKKIVFEFDNIFRCYGVLIIKDKDIFITSGMSNNLRIYSIKNFNCLYVEENAHNDTINGISKINDSKIISFSWDHNIKIWEINYEILNELNLI